MAEAATYAELVRALAILRPGAMYYFDPDNYNELVWLDTEQDAPYPSEIDDVVATLRATSKVGGIRAEALRRIRVRYEDWQQSYMIVQGLRLQNAWRQNDTWTELELALWEELEARWDWIDSVRAVADQLEIDQPDNYTVDDYWPAP